MSIFKKFFGEKKTNPVVPPQQDIQPKVDPSKDPNMIRVYDSYGREYFITREAWRDILRGNLKKAWNQPDDLYNMIVSALNDGLRSEVIEASKHLYKIDPDPVRSGCIWGIILMEENRLDEAETVFRDVTARQGEQGVIFTNWAKIYAKRQDDAKTEELLWHALELDPNQSNGMGWYEVLHRERGGKEAGQDALRRVASLPDSWRARLWLARAALENRQLDKAIALYQEALSYVPQPVPADFLMQLSGDLGNKGHLVEILQLCEPHFDPGYHGIQVGNNLIKAHLDLGQFDEASHILNQLYAQKRPDWQQNLTFWDTAIAKARVETKNPPPPEMQIGMGVLKEPIWLREDSPALPLFAVKPTDGPIIAFLGSSVETGATEAKQGLSDTPGRVSRALPLFLAEQIHLTSTGIGTVMTPWISARGCGFVVTGAPWQAESCHNARQCEPVADYLVTFHIDAKEEPWKVEMILYRTIDQTTLGSVRATFTSAQPETAFTYMVQQLWSLLQREAGIEAVANRLYQVPTGTDFPYYLLRLEQALAVSASLMENANEFLSGEREIINGNIQLNLNQPQNVTTRLLLAQTLKQMKKLRPNILPEFREKIALLQKEKPLTQPAQDIVQGIFDDVFST